MSTPVLPSTGTGEALPRMAANKATAMMENFIVEGCVGKLLGGMLKLMNL